MATLLRSDGSQLVVMIENKKALEKLKREQGIVLEENCIEIEFQQQGVEVIDGQLRPVAAPARMWGGQRNQQKRGVSPSWGAMGITHERRGMSSVALDSNNLEGMALHLRDLVERSQREREALVGAKSVLSEGGVGGEAKEAEAGDTSGGRGRERALLGADDDAPTAEEAEEHVTTQTEAELDTVLSQILESFHRHGNIHEQ